MTAFAVSPMPGTPVSGNSEAFAAIAVAVALVMIGTGLSSNLIAGRLRATSSRLDHIAHHDALTGLANRRQLMDELAARCAALGAGGEPFALLTIDLDRFKLVNDTLGHHAGDQVLKEAAARLASVAEPRVVACLRDQEVTSSPSWRRSRWTVLIGWKRSPLAWLRPCRTPLS
jgi:predicted signal transduction protein with EAL and GGDEF domain